MSEKRTLLTIEDEEFLREGIAHLFTDEGWTVLESGDARDGIEKFRNHSVDVVLTDLLLPDMDGTTLLREIADIDPYVPSIVLTGYGTMKRAVAALRAGASDFVMKPFENDALIAAVEKVWRRGPGRSVPNEITRQSEVSFKSVISLNGASALPKALVDGVVEKLDGVARAGGYHRKRLAIRRASEEALENAFKHGAQANGEIIVEAKFDAERARVTITDSGKGFAPPPDSMPHESGRGIFLIRAFADEVTWTPPGNRVEMVFKGN